MTPVSYLHGKTVMRFGFMLERSARERQLGDVVTEVGVVLKVNPDTVFAPDIAFIRRERVPADIPRGPPSSSPVTLTEVDTLDLGEVIEGFRCEVRGIFD